LPFARSDSRRSTRKMMSIGVALRAHTRPPAGGPGRPRDYRTVRVRWAACAPARRGDERGDERGVEFSPGARNGRFRRPSPPLEGRIGRFVAPGVRDRHATASVSARSVRYVPGRSTPPAKPSPPPGLMGRRIAARVGRGFPQRTGPDAWDAAATGIRGPWLTDKETHLSPCRPRDPSVPPQGRVPPRPGHLRSSQRLSERATMAKPPSGETLHSVVRWWRSSGTAPASVRSCASRRVPQRPGTPPDRRAGERSAGRYWGESAV